MPGKNTPQYLIVYRCIIRDEDGNILLLKRSKNRKYNPEKWELPGGKSQAIDDANFSLEKIIERETNLIVVTSNKSYYYSTRMISEKGKYQGFNYIEVTGVANYIGGDIKTGGDHTNYVWTKPDDVFKYDLSLESKKSITQFLANLSAQSKTPVLLSAKVIVKDKGKILFIKRSATDSFGNKWELPGGKLDYFEVINELVKREVFEETGLVTRVDKHILYINSHVLNQGKYRGYTFIETISEARLIAGRIKLSVEHSEYRWVNPKDIFKLDLVDHIRLPLTEIFLPVRSHPINIDKKAKKS